MQQYAGDSVRCL